ncbi:PhnD/SsuA/transferrin family substrate-binding protein [Alkalimonas amylolytica]|uniref:Phosphonate transport system substrate-binding protein n=1 Tax=Alkalimonas amylolytica TaxID=152573 RepID=A0A1H4DZ05_ALKAM|nr:PhnD/SsuA/transferrin family substrate-binding protein [Alkalimonas amylolytica]SEA78004.1 phosphonate transport system substrate-binding protein [Alkalimonas amylolytica]
MAHWLFVIFTVSVLVLSQPVSAQSCPSPLRFADTGIEGAEELQRAYHEFVALMLELLDVQVQFFPVGNRTTAVNALRFRQVDLVLAGPTEFLLMQQRLQGIQPVAAIARPEYAAVFIVPEHSSIQRLTDLKGRHVAMKDHGSTTGHIIPSYMLHRAGLDLDRDVRISLIDGARMAALAAGEVDAVGTGLRDFAPFVAQQAQPYRILAQSDDMPGDPIIAGGHVPAACVTTLQLIFQQHAEPILQAILNPGARDKYLEARMIPVTKDDYQFVADAMKVLGILR